MSSRAGWACVETGMRKPWWVLAWCWLPSPWLLVGSPAPLRMGHSSASTVKVNGELLAIRCRVLTTLHRPLFAQPEPRFARGGAGAGRKRLLPDRDVRPRCLHHSSPGIGRRQRRLGIGDPANPGFCFPHEFAAINGSSYHPAGDRGCHQGARGLHSTSPIAGDRASSDHRRVLEPWWSILSSHASRVMPRRLCKRPGQIRVWPTTRMSPATGRC